MRRFLSGLFSTYSARAEARRKRALERAAREMMRGDQTYGGGIWRSGKGGSHPG
jgi:hypothetical protein